MGLIRWIDDRMHAWMYRGSPKREMFGIMVVAVFAEPEEAAAIFPKVEAALCLIRDHSPVRFAQVQRDVPCIWVWKLHPFLAVWNVRRQMCEVSKAYLAAAETSAAYLACTLVHEAAHALLFRLGFGYAAAERLRVERLCFRAERAFARRLPDAEER